MADEKDESKTEETEAPETDAAAPEGEAPAEGTEAAPAEGTEAAPAEGTEAAPAEGTEAAPAEGTEAASAEGAEATPAEGAEATPAEGAEDDPWGAAMAEQEASETVDSAPQRPPATFGELKAEAAGKGISNLELILDIPVTISVELGRTQLYIKDLISLGQGAVMELDKLAGDPMEIFVNGHLVAKGETVVVNDKFGIKLTDIVSPSERINNLT